jgi:hypothetical protein
LIDTIAMIGSPASRGAVASVGGAGRSCLAAASAVSAASAAIAASVTMAGRPQRRIATVDRAVANRFAMPCPRSKCLSARASIKCQIAIIFDLTNRRHQPRRQFAPGAARSVGNSLIYDDPCRRKAGSRLEIGAFQAWSCSETTSALEGGIDRNWSSYQDQRVRWIEPKA